MFPIRRLREKKRYIGKEMIREHRHGHLCREFRKEAPSDYASSFVADESARPLIGLVDFVVLAADDEEEFCRIVGQGPTLHHLRW